jgi:serine O-acetyltransferase
MESVADARVSGAEEVTHAHLEPSAAPQESLSDLSKPHMLGGAKTARELWWLINSDLFRYEGATGFKPFWKHYIFTPGFRYSYWMRLCGYLRRGAWMRYTLYIPAKMLLLRYRYKFGIAIPEYTRIGPGLFINRFGGVMINGDAIIGANFNITHGAMVGQLNRGARRGSPIIGDRVFLASGAKVMGGIRLGDDCAVGANAVVTKDVPASGVVVGIPGKVISQEGSAAYVNRTVDAKPPTRKK